MTYLLVRRQTITQTEREEQKERNLHSVVQKW